MTELCWATIPTMNRPSPDSEYENEQKYFLIMDLVFGLRVINTTT